MSEDPGGEDGEGAPIPPGPSPAAAPRPKRKKRRREGEKPKPVARPIEPEEESTEEADPGEALTMGGDPPSPPPRAIPAFAEGWPRDEALDALVAAFEAGDYARVRREAPALAKRTESDAVRRAARELRRRLDPDPLAVYMLMAAAALLVFLAGWYWLHPHTP